MCVGIITYIVDNCAVGARPDGQSAHHNNKQGGDRCGLIFSAFTRNSELARQDGLLQVSGRHPTCDLWLQNYFPKHLAIH